MAATENPPAPATTDEVTSALWEAVGSLKTRFNLSDAEMRRVLGDMPRSTYYKGLKTQRVAVSRDTRDRVSLLLGIYTALRTLFVDAQQATTWIDRDNTLPPFNGVTPRQYLTSGHFMDLARVRTFLDYWN